MASSILELIIRSSKQGQGGKAAAAELKELKGTVGEVTQELLGFNLGTMGAVGAVMAAGAAVNQAVIDYQTYAETIRGMAAITGTGVEETSRLVQAFDDLGIAQAQTQTMMEGAAKKGFIASIENVANLADQYNALNTQQEKNKLLTDKLGKSGLDMAKAFEQGGTAIREAAASQADGMIITEKNIRATEELRVAQDNLNDAWTAVSNSGAKLVVPAMTDVLTVMQKQSEEGITWRNFWESIPFINVGVVAAELLKARAIRESNDAGKDLVDLIGPMTEGIAGYSGAMETHLPILYSTASGWNRLPSSMGNYAKKAEEAAAATEKMKKPMDDVRQALDNLDQAQQSFGQGIAGQISSQLEAAGLSPDQLMQALAQLDEQFGTTTARTQTMQDWITNAVARYQDGNGINEFASTIAQIQNAFWSSDPGVVSATNTLQQKAQAMISIGPIYVGNEMDYQELLARLKYDLPGMLG